VLKRKLFNSPEKGFTLLEIIIVIVVVGILAALGMITYSRSIEKGRAAETKTILGQLRQSQRSYYLQNGNYAASLDSLEVVLPTVCDSQHFFVYSTAGNTGMALRCTTGGKYPDSATLYTINIDYDASTFGGTPGYY